MADPIGTAASVIAIVQLSTSVAKVCNQYLKDVKHATDDIKRLLDQVKHLGYTAEGAEKLLNGPNARKYKTSEKLRDALNKSTDHLKEIEGQLEPDSARRSMRRFGLRALKWPFQSKEVKALVEDLDRCAQNISRALQIDELNKSDDRDLRDVLDRLSVAEGAAYDSHANDHNSTCLENTREELLQQIQKWADDPGGLSVCWLNGKAGTGKSTISRTVASSLARQGKLGASFFFKRGEASRGNKTRFFTTIAADLARRVPATARHIKDALDEYGANIVVTNSREQFENLFQKPLSNITKEDGESGCVVVVVDALDECAPDDDIKLLIHLLTSVKPGEARLIKVFLTSRPETPVRIEFKKRFGSYHEIVLDEVPTAIIEHDIATFTKHELEKSRTEYNVDVSRDRQLSPSWPSQAALEAVVKAAVPLFIFAATVCRFVAHRNLGSPEEQLQEWLEYHANNTTKGRSLGFEEQLDMTYMPVLQRQIGKAGKAAKDKIIGEFQQVVGAIITLADPLSPYALSQVIGVGKNIVDRRLDGLHSVLNIPSDSTSPVRLLHLSFRDYLVSADAGDGSSFRVDIREAHARLADGCLALLSQQGVLKKDICNLKHPGVSRSDVPLTTINTCLPPHVQYACIYWTYHCKESRCLAGDDGLVHRFLKIHFLHWLEALALTGHIFDSLAMITDVMRLLEPGSSTDLGPFLRDCLRNVQYFKHGIDMYPLQAYYSVTVFAPKRSIVREMFSHYYPSWLIPPPCVRDDWDHCLHTLEGHRGDVWSVAFSPGSDRIASGALEGKVKLWDPVSGACTATLEGDEGPILSLSFSSDGTRLLSASEKGVVFWDLATEVCTTTLHRSDDESIKVINVAFSPNSAWVAVLESHSMQLYDAHTEARKWIRPNDRGAIEWFGHVAFSPDSEQLACGIGTAVKILDVKSGKCLHALDDKISGDRLVESMAWSPNSSLLAVGMILRKHHHIIIWNTTTWDHMEVPNLIESSALTFSPDSNQLATVDRRKHGVCFFDVRKASQRTLCRGNTYPVSSIAFSPDYQLLASSCHDGTVKIWDVPAELEDLRPEEPPPHIYPKFRFSPDGSVVGFARDQTLHLLDGKSGDLRMAFKTIGDGIILRIKFSSCGNYLALVKWPGVIQIFDTNDGKSLAIWEDYLQSSDEYLHDMLFSPDSKWFAAASGSFVNLWNWATKRWHGELSANKETVVNSLLFSPDSKQIVSIDSEVSVRIWDVASRTCTAHFENKKPAWGMELCGISYTLRKRSYGAREELIPSSELADSRRIDISYGRWLEWDGRKILWLPPSFRPERYDRTDSTVAFVPKGHDIIFLTVSSEPD